MGRQLDGTAAQLLADELTERGITLLLEESLASVHGEDSVQGIRTRNGRYLPCDALFFATGTQPNLTLAKRAGLACGRGIRVDDTMTTADPDVLAIGEIAEYQHQCYGTTPAAQAQATVAAAQLAGDTWTRYGGNVAFNVLKLAGLSLCSMGEISVDPKEPGTEEIILLDRAERYYQKCVVRNNRLVGAILFGDMALMPTLKSLVESRLELDEQRRTLLRAGAASPREPVAGALVCSCNQVGTENLERAIADGCVDLPALCNQTGAGLGCGSCKPEIAALLDHHAGLATTR
jgi:ferredoxin-nitrate reductase